jgi:hypothetical protein
MSIFRETFEPFVKNELKRRQDGMLTRTPAFLHQLNSRSAWVRMTSGVNVNNSNDLAKKYVLQGGILNVATTGQGANITDTFALKSGLGGASNTYSNLTVGGATNRLGIKPMPGITNVSIQSKGAYGSLQEATVSFVCWDIKQLEELELLYMRPGYTVLFEMGWDYAKANGVLPRYDILNQTNLVLNDGFKQIYELIEKSNGNYNALLGYVKNYSWSARDDGGYDCTTSIISLGEILESLKCNWVPINTKAFDQGGEGILGLPYSPRVPEKIIESYKQGIIPGLIREIYEWARTKTGGNFVITDNGVTYEVFRKKVGDAKKNDRGGLPKHLSTGNTDYELYITLESLCNLLNRHVLLKDEKNNPLVQVTTNEQAPNGAITNVPLKCIASPLSLSTNLGVCYIENPNWESLKIQTPTTAAPAVTTSISPDLRISIEAKRLGNVGVNRFAKNITKTEFTPPITGTNLIVSAVTSFLNKKEFYTYTSTLGPDPNDPNKKLGLQGDINQLAKELGDALNKVELIPGTNAAGNAILTPKFFFSNGSSFLSSDPSNTQTVNFLDYFGVVDQPGRSGGSGVFNGIYDDLFLYDYDPTPPGKLDPNSSIGLEDPFASSDSLTSAGVPFVKDNIGTIWTKDLVVAALQTALSKVPLSNALQTSLTNQLPQVAQQVAGAATQAGVNEANKKFLVPVTGNSQRQLGNIGNIYVNLEYIYDKAISRNLASNDTQTKNVISIRDFLQDVLREVQNSIGNINTFDLQVDDRNSIGRIIDISSTQSPSSVKDPLFELQIHNLNSCVRTYNFQSKIFPEMGSIIAISAQDPEGIGTLGYDNATLVAWNKGITDRLIPKRLTNPNDLLDKDNKPVTYLLPFLTQMYKYFSIIAGTTSGDDINLVYGGLNFAFRDFLAHLDRTNGGNNNFKTIIPTELHVTLDGIGGLIIGNLFKINEDIVPKGYTGVVGRKLAYIVTGLGHNISNNDWTTELSAYPIVFEQSTGTEVYKQWNNQQYPGTIISAGGRNFNVSGASVNNFSNQSDIDRAFKFFIDNGYSKAAAAALVGSFLQESALIPSIVNFNPNLAFNASGQTYAAGIAQWVGPRRVELLKYAKGKGITISNYDNAVKIVNNSTKTTNSKNTITNAFTNIDLNTQLEFVNKEAAKYPGFSSFKASTDLSQAVLWVYETYEGGNYTTGAALGNREIYANELFNK